MEILAAHPCQVPAPVQVRKHFAAATHCELSSVYEKAKNAMQEKVITLNVDAVTRFSLWQDVAVRNFGSIWNIT